MQDKAGLSHPHVFQPDHNSLPIIHSEYLPNSSSVSFMASHYPPLTTQGLLPQQSFLPPLPNHHPGSRLASQFTHSPLENGGFMTTATPGGCLQSYPHQPVDTPSYAQGAATTVPKPMLPTQPHMSYPTSSAGSSPPQRNNYYQPSTNHLSSLSPTNMQPESMPGCSSNVSSPIAAETVYQQQSTTEASVAIDSANVPSPNMPLNSSDHAAMMSRSNSEEGLTANGHSSNTNGEKAEGLFY